MANTVGDRSTPSALESIDSRCHSANTPQTAATMIGRLGTSLNCFSAGSFRIARMAAAMTSSARMRPKLA